MGPIRTRASSQCSLQLSKCSPKTPPATQPAAVNFNGRDVQERIRQQQTGTVAGWGRARNYPPFTTGDDLQVQPWLGP